MTTLREVVATTESGGDRGAIRFEPTVYATLKLTDDRTQNATGALIRLVERINGCSPDTARIILASSWGAYQVMGETLYGSLGYESPIRDYWSSDDDQDASFDRYAGLVGITGSQLTDASWIAGEGIEPLRFAAAYNGPGDPSGYLARLVQEYRSLSASA